MPEYDFERFFESAVDMLCVADAEGRLLRINSSFRNVLGWPSEQMLGRPAMEFVHPDDVKATRDEFRKLARGIPMKLLSNRFRCSDGTFRYLRWTARQDEDTGLIFAIARDTTELIKENERFQLVLDASPVSLLMVDPNGVIRSANKEAAKLFRYPDRTLVGMTVESIVPVHQREQHVRDRAAFFQERESRTMGKGRHVQGVRRDGTTFEADIGLNPVMLGDDACVLCSVIDVTLQKETEEKLTRLAEELESSNHRLVRLARTDRLTGLLNRRAFDEELGRHIRLSGRMGRPLSLLMVDIDHFKRFNDDHGHLIGDETLVTVARLLGLVARTTDLVARFGGEEFALVLPNTAAGDAQRVAERCFDAALRHDWPHDRVTFSIGIATRLCHGDQEEKFSECAHALISEADQALYHSKDNGRNRATQYSDIAGNDAAT